MGTMSELSSIRDELVDEARGLSFTYNHLISTATGHCEYGIADIHSRGLIVLMADYIERYRQELAMITNRRYSLKISNFSEWAFSLRASSNWVRHNSEWYETFYYYRYQTIENRPVEDITYLSKKIESFGYKKNELKNIKCVLGLLDSSEISDLFKYGNGSALKIALKLGLLDSKLSSKNLNEFFVSCIK